MSTWYETNWRDFYTRQRVAGLYDSALNPVAFLKGGARRFHRACLDLLDLAPGSRVIDLCCGTGDLARAMARELGGSGAVFGIDLSLIMLARAEARNRGNSARFEVMDAECTRFLGESFDAVTLVAALHEMPFEARTRVLAEAWRLLKPGGRLLVGEHLVAGPLPWRIAQGLIFGAIARKAERAIFADLVARGLETEIRAARFDVLLERPLPRRMFHLVLAEKPHLIAPNLAARRALDRQRPLPFWRRCFDSLRCKA